MGNDLVDLKDPENIGKSGDERFLSRVFTDRERERITRAKAPDLLLWSLWAAKEAAYKAVSRADPAVCSIPHRYPVLLENEEAMAEIVRRSGRVTTPRGELALEVVVSAEWVHALAAGTREALQRLCHRVDRLPEGGAAADPSAFVRGALLREIARRLASPMGDLSVVKDPIGPGAPRIFFRGVPLAVEASLSHDGRFAAFAFDPLTLVPSDGAERAIS